MQMIYRPRALRNNNPLNIRKGATRWTGALPASRQTDSLYVQFKTLDYGYRAAWKMLDSIRLRLGSKLPFTVVQIIREWAYAGEGKDPDQYIARLLLLTGLSPIEVLPPPSQDCYGQLHSLLAAMTCIECSIDEADVNQDAIHAGYILAFE